MNSPSPEQQAVIDHVRNGHNVMVEACAGSGKSTTILSMAKELSHLRILQFTYNKMLRLEIKDKVTTLKLNNLEVHTFHSFAVKHYTDEAAVDTGIRQLLASNMACRRPIPRYDIVVLDECQDMTLLFFHLVQKALRDMICHANDVAAEEEGEGGTTIHPHNIQLVVLGDARQTLYEFKGADARFLTMADQLWSSAHPRLLSSPVFQRCTLRTSYRLTRPMATFVNQALLLKGGGDGDGGNGDTSSLSAPTMLAARDGNHVTYMRRSKDTMHRVILYRILHYINMGDSPADIFILAHSVKSGNFNIVNLANRLVEHGIPIHIPAFEATDDMDDCVVEGKVVFSSYHQAKGRERKHVFLVGFDASYFSYVSSAEDKTRCPNTLYVGCTRATQNLFLCEYDTSCPLDFLGMTHHQMNACGFVNFQGTPQTQFFVDDFSKGLGSAASSAEIVTRDTSPTKLTKFVSDKVLDEVTPLLERLFVVEEPGAKEGPVDVPRMIRTKMGLYEDVSDLNGIAIPAYYYDHLRASAGGGAGGGPGEQSLRAILSNKMLRWKQKNEHGFLLRAIAKLPVQCDTISEYLFLANLCACAQEELYFKLKQIDDDEYVWLNDDVMQGCMATLDRHLGPAFRGGGGGGGNVEVEAVLVDKSNEMDPKRARIDAALFPFFGHELRFKFIARADVVTADTLWELKCTSKLTVDHMLQTAVYAWIQRVTSSDADVVPGHDDWKACKLLNIRSGEVRRLEATMEELTRIVVLLLRNKFAKGVRLTDAEFLSAVYSLFQHSQS